MKIKKGVVSFILLAVLTLSSIGIVSANDDPGSFRPSNCIAPIEITIEIPTVTE